MPDVNASIARILGLAAGGRYFSAEDALLVTVYNGAAGVTVELHGRFLSVDTGSTREVVRPLTPATNRSQSTLLVAFEEGVLFDAELVVTAGTPLDGQTYAILSHFRGALATGVEVTTLAADTITRVKRLAWPVGGVRSSLEGKGALRMISGTTPGAGAEISETVPTGARFELLSIAFGLTTAVAAANRIVKLQLDDGVNGYFIDSPNFTQVASLVNVYSFAAGQSKLAAPNALAVMGNVPTPNELLAGHRIRTSTTALQAADQFGQPFYLVRERLEPLS